MCQGCPQTVDTDIVPPGQAHTHAQDETLPKKERKKGGRRRTKHVRCTPRLPIRVKKHGGLPLPPSPRAPPDTVWNIKVPLDVVRNSWLLEILHIQ